MKSEIRKIIEKELAKYEVKEMTLNGDKYNLRIFKENPRGNLYEGFLFARIEKEKRIKEFRKIDPYKEGRAYCPRILIIEDVKKDTLFIRDTLHNKHIIKTFKKINKTFLNKFRKALSEPNDQNLSKLFDRTDVIEEFYILYKKAREYLLKNISGISEEEEREEFVDNFMMQMLTLWYLQERGFFNNDKSYFITKFKELEQNGLFNEFKGYYEFLEYLFEKISGHEDKQYYEDNITGKVVIIGPAVFLNGEHSKAVSIPDKCFYKQEMTDILINTPPKKVSQDVPLLNLFESRDWTEGNIDEFVLGAIYEKLITYMERKKLGAYYTPPEITKYICKNTIEPYLVDRVNEEFKKNFESIDQIIESNNKDVLFHLFKQLKEIKILDPAVGSAHFLADAIEVLVNIYEKVWNKAKEIGLRKGLEITAADERGELKTINLLETSDDERFKLMIKFFIILSKNIYGVDINPSALKVAKARLFLTLAKHFKVGKDKDVFLRFPNVHFNLREGNSLIGYVNIDKEKPNEQQQLDFSINEGQAEYIIKRIKVISELKPYLESTAKALKINGNIVKEVEELNEILAKEKFSWRDFKKVLRTKEKLIRILIASLNSQYAVPLNELLREISDLFNQELDEKFAEEYKIDLDELKKIKTFHWMFEFPEVFLERGGFDVVVGNPPYVGEKTNKEIFEHIKKLSSDLWEGRSNMAYFFTIRSLNLIREKSYLSLIIPRYWITADYSKKLREYIFLKNTLLRIVDFEDMNPFPGKPGMNFSIVFVRKQNPITYNGLLTLIYPKKGLQKKFRYGRVTLEENKLKFPDDIADYIRRISIPLKELFDVNQGIITGADRESKSKNSKGIFVLQQSIDSEILDKIIKSKKEQTLLRRWFKNSEIKRYYLDLDDKKKYLIYLDRDIDEKDFPVIIEHLSKYKSRLSNRREFKNGKRKWYLLHWSRDENIFINPKIVTPQRSKINDFSFVPLPFYASADVYFITSRENDAKKLKQVLITLNSKLIYYYLRKEGKLKGEQLELYFTPLKTLPIRIIKNDCSLYLSCYMLFLNATEERRKSEKELIEFIDKQIIDSLIYELYFKEKFHEDGLYPEPKEYLLEAVSRHLKPIDYERWAELYWKKQLEDNLTKKEEEELKRLEKENMETIKNAYNNLKNDREIQEWIDKIKSHEWIKVIEGKR